MKKTAWFLLVMLWVSGVAWADYRYNPYTGKLDYYEKDGFKGVSASAPTSPTEGWTYINSGDNKLYIYYGASWQELHTLTPASYSFFQLEGVGVTDVFLLEDGFKLALEA